MSAHCLLPALLLFAAVFASAAADEPGDLYESKVYKGQADVLLDMHHKFSIPQNQCYGVFYAELLKDQCYSVQLAALQVILVDKERYPTVNITDDLRKAIVTRPLPCKDQVVVTINAHCAGLIDDDSLEK